LRVVLACLACIVASAMYGLSSPLMKRALARMQPLQSAAGIYLMSSLMLAPFAAPALPQAHFTPLALLLVTVLGVVTSGLAYWLHLRILIHVTPVAAMSPTFMIPVFGVAWAHLLLDEPLGPGIWLGGALVLLASALVTGFQPWRKRLEEIDAKP
ncbi:MAG: DMT family transporter, partial [Rhodoferax sp.]|nr:DMT family transporter [Rhodoferax sp.]